MKAKTCFLSSVALCALLSGCAAQDAPSAQGIEQNIASTNSGAFGQCIEHAYLSGMRLDEAKFLKGKIDSSAVIADGFYYRQGEVASKIALDERKKAEQACHDFIASQFASNSTSSNVALNTGSPAVYFDLGSSTLSDEEKEKLSSIVRDYKRSPAREVVITGRTDTTGTTAFNQALSTRRAVAVFDELKRQARAENITLPPARIQIVGAGEVGGPDNQENRADRRVDVALVPSGRAQLGDINAR